MTARHVLPRDIKRARQLRREMPLAERLLWERLRGLSKAFNIAFRRQHPIPPYTVDFIYLKARLIIEIDGYSHDVRIEQDKVREMFLRDKGFTTLHFSNEDVLSDPDAIAETILVEVQRNNFEKNKGKG